MESYAGILGQTVVPEQRAEVTEAAQIFGDDTHLTQLQIYLGGAVAVSNPDRLGAITTNETGLLEIIFFHCFTERMKKIESTTKMIINFQPLTKGPKKTLLPF